MHMLHVIGDSGMEEVDGDTNIPQMLACHGHIATGSVTSCQEFWRTFVRISMVMDWIEHGYALLCTTATPAAMTMQNAESTLEHHEFVSGSVAEMLRGSAVTKLHAPGRNADGREPP